MGLGFRLGLGFGLGLGLGLGLGRRAPLRGQQHRRAVDERLHPLEQRGELRRALLLRARVRVRVRARARVGVRAS